MRRAIACAAALAAGLLAPAAWAQSDGPTIAREEVESLSPPALARRLLGASAALVVDSHVTPDDTGLLAMFAGQPRGTGYPGLCVVDLYRVMLLPISDSLADAPLRVFSLDRDRRYRVVGPVARAPLAHTATEALDKACEAEATPVATDGRGYFSADRGGLEPLEPGAAIGVVAAVAEAQARMRADAKIPVKACRDETRARPRLACNGVAARISALPLGELWGAGVSRCEDDAMRYCVSAVFSDGRGRDGKPYRLWIEFRTEGADPSVSTRWSLASVSISRSGFVD